MRKETKRVLQIVLTLLLVFQLMPVRSLNVYADDTSTVTDTTDVTSQSTDGTGTNDTSDDSTGTGDGTGSDSTPVDSIVTDSGNTDTSSDTSGSDNGTGSSTNTAEITGTSDTSNVSGTASVNGNSDTGSSDIVSADSEQVTLMSAPLLLAAPFVPAADTVAYTTDAQGIVTEFTSVKDAFDSIGADETATVTLAKDVTTSEQLFVKDGSIITFDLKSFTFSSTFCSSKEAFIRVTDESTLILEAEQNGSIKANNSQSTSGTAVAVYVNNSSFIMNSGNIYAYKWNAICASGEKANVIINDGYVQSTGQQANITVSVDLKAHLEMNGGTISSSNNQGCLGTSHEGTVEINGGTITNKGNTAVRMEGGTITFNDGVISQTGKGHTVLMAKIDEYGYTDAGPSDKDEINTFIMNGGTIISDNNHTHAIVCICSDRGYFKFNDGIIKGNTDIDGSKRGTHVQVVGGIMDMYGGTIRDIDWGGVVIGSGGTFNMYDGLITDCDRLSSSNGGGGVTVYDAKSTANIYGGTITNCTSGRGGGIYNKGTLNIYNLTLTDCSVPENYASSGSTNGIYGGAIYNVSGATANIYSAYISGNTAKNGGAIYNEGTINLKNGLNYNDENGDAYGELRIVKNSASGGTGGGIYNTGTVTVEDGIVLCNNTGKSNANDIYNKNGATLNLGEVCSDEYLDPVFTGLCNHLITHWLTDLSDDRWGCHNITDVVDPKTYTDEMYIIAAHAINLTVSKKWVDTPENMARTESISFDLMTNGNKVDSYTLSEENNWSTTISVNPRYIYSVVEADVAGYTATYSTETDADGNISILITNTRKVKNFDIDVDKRSTNLDDDLISNVTLTVPGEDIPLATDVVFVLDKSNSTNATIQQGIQNLLDDLTDVLDKTNAKINVGVVVFTGEAHSFGLYDLATQRGEIDTAVKAKFSHGTNIHSGLLAAQKMLAEDTDTPDGRKYMVLVSDGISYLFNENPTSVAMNIPGGDSGWYNQACYDWVVSWALKYGTPSYVPENWDTYLAGIGSILDKQGDTYDYVWEVDARPEGTPMDDRDSAKASYACSADKALYMVNETYKEMSSVYNCYAYNLGTGSDYKFGPSFMNYLANGQTVTFDGIKNDIIKVVGAGSYVVDYIGYDDGSKYTDGDGNGYDFDFITDSSTLSLKVGNDEYPVTSASDTTYYFDINQDGTAEYKVEYVKGNGTTEERFIWTFNVDVNMDAPVSLTYQVKLTNPSTKSARIVRDASEFTNKEFGTYDEDGSKFNGVQNGTLLFTNQKATLYPVPTVDDGSYIEPINFPMPAVSYKLAPLYLVKTLSRYNETLNGSTFVFSVSVTYKDTELFNQIVGMTFDSNSASKTVIIADLPVGAEVTVTEMYSGSTYKLTSENPLKTTIIKDDPATDVVEVAKVSFTNDYDTKLIGGSGAINEHCKDTVSYGCVAVQQ
ncbi:MAG: Cna B-type domain-containing protein [Erysipelotrichaceae bacterium]|nr:Cna B-type domain-containing protein [Erysipelotrichaceae bacterium]